MRQFKISNVFNKGHNNFKKDRLSVVSIPLVQQDAVGAYTWASSY